MLRQEFLLAFAMFFGHGALWTYLFNLLHALPVPCRVKRIVERILAAIAAAPLLALPYWAEGYTQLSSYSSFISYKYFCWFIGVYALVSWGRRQLHSDAASGMISLDARPVTVRGPDDPPLLTKGWQFFSRTPLNESEYFVVEKKTLALPGLPNAWKGMTIAHISDIHLTGRIAKPYYDAVFEEVAALNADLIAVTGDIIERTECDEWLESTLGRLKAPLGVYFILGNHDLEMPSVDEVRGRLEGLGLEDVGGRVLQRSTDRGKLTLAGNELPWLGEAPKLTEEREPTELRLGLIHTPDVFRWSARNHCQLALAGHTHGGQIRLPLIGPMICPSVYGCRYAEGVFRRGDTILHVSRGIGAMHPVRYRCPPEITLIELA